METRGEGFLEWLGRKCEADGLPGMLTVFVCATVFLGIIAPVAVRIALEVWHALVFQPFGPAQVR